MYVPFLLLLLLSLPLWAEEDSDGLVPGNSCRRPLLLTPLRIHAQVRATDLDQRILSFQIHWTHIPGTVDTFLLHNPQQQDTLEWVSTRNLRTLRSRKWQSFRAMANHHLRERIWNTTLRFDDLELLSKGDFLCQDTLSKKNHQLKTAYSGTWYTLNWDSLEPPSRFSMWGLHKVKRLGFLSGWSLIPSHIHLEETPTLWATMTIQEEPLLIDHPFEFGKAWTIERW